MRKGLSAVLAAVLLGPAPNVAAQTEAQGAARPVISTPVLIIDSDRLFYESTFGQRVVAEVEANGAELAAENRQIEADLEAEERELTEVRATAEPDAFRELADVFDEKVQQVRAAQIAKGRALNDLVDQERARFEAAAAPVLERLMREADAAVILERRAVFANRSAIEITDAAIALLDETLGSGTE